MLLLTGAAAVLILVCAWFLINVSTMGISQTHQSRALDAAALAVASDLGKIVINDPTLGYVGLFNQPSGTGNLIAKDNLPLPVRGINSLLATARLDLIFADLISNETLRKLVLEDYKNILSAKTALVAAMRQSVAESGPKPTDAFGNKVDAFEHARETYLANGGDVVSAQSFHVDLGSASGLSSDIVIPSPGDYANISAEEQIDGFYRAFTDVKYKATSFVFAGAGTTPALITCSDFKEDGADPDLPLVIPDLVRTSGLERSPLNSSAKISAVSYALPGGEVFHYETAGALSISFADGAIPELKSFQNLFVDSSMLSSDASVGQASGGDFPGDHSVLQNSCSALPAFLASQPNVSQSCVVAFYDWLRRGGYCINVDALLQMMKTPLAPTSALGPFMNVFRFQPDGSISNTLLQMRDRYCQLSDSQLVMITQSKALVSEMAGWHYYDVMVQDQVRQPGNTKGGLHGGEPLVDVRLTANPSYPNSSYLAQPNENTGALRGNSMNICWAGANGGWAFGQWKTTLCLQSTYNFISNHQYASVPGGDNSPAVIPSQLDAKKNERVPRFSNPLQALAVDISFHKLVLAMPRTN